MVEKKPVAPAAQPLIDSNDIVVAGFTALHGTGKG